MKYLLFKPLDPLLGTVFDAVGSFGLQQAAQASNTSASKKLMDYQSQLQARQQERLMAKQYQLQVGSMMAAGLNPATANGFSSAVSAPMPSASASTPSSPYSSNLVQNMLASKQAEQAEANVNLTNSQANYYDVLARKTGTEDDLLNVNLMYAFPIYEAELKRTISEGELNMAKVDEVNQSISNMKRALNKLDSEIELNKSIQKLNDKELQWFDKRMSKTIQQIISQTAANYASASQSSAQAKYISNEDLRQAEQLYSKIFMMNSQGSMYRSQASFADANRDLMDFNVRMAKKYGEAQIWVNMGTQVLNSASSMVSAVKGFGFAPMTFNNASNSPAQSSQLGNTGIPRYSKEYFDKYVAPPKIGHLLHK